MRRVDVRDINDIGSIAVSASDYDDLMDCKAFRRLSQLLYGTIDSLYGDLIRPGLSNESMHFLRGRISAIEEILAIKDTLKNDAVITRLAADSKDGEVLDGDTEYRAALHNLNEGNNNV